MMIVIKKESFCRFHKYTISFLENFQKKVKNQRTAASMFHAVFVVRHAILRCICRLSCYFAVYLSSVMLFYTRRSCVITKA
jgi:hypothetical protein